MKLFCWRLVGLMDVLVAAEGRMVWLWESGCRSVEPPGRGGVMLVCLDRQIGSRFVWRRQSLWSAKVKLYLSYVGQQAA